MSSTFSSSNSLATDDSKIILPAMGKYWQSIPAIRLHITKWGDRSNSTQLSGSIGTSQFNNGARTIIIIKSTMTRTNIDCSVTITNAGII